jgi:hypothetical protein
LLVSFLLHAALAAAVPWPYCLWLQVVLDTAQVAAVILSQDLLWQLPDWTAAGLSGLIITQATSWQWVPFDCLLPGMSQASGAVVQVMMVLLLPCELCCCCHLSCAAM